MSARVVLHMKWLEEPVLQQAVVFGGLGFRRSPTQGCKDAKSSSPNFKHPEMLNPYP